MKKSGEGRVVTVSTIHLPLSTRMWNTKKKKQNTVRSRKKKRKSILRNSPETNQTTNEGNSNRVFISIVGGKRIQ
jgi:hypothetical protein